MEKIHLSARMMAVAEMVPYGAHLADVGTDHGYIPLWLLQEKRIASAIASDLREGPLQHAIASAKAAGLSDHVRFLLCDGISPSCQNHCDTVVIAGMGGETIAGILENALWTRKNVRLILQPQSKQEVLQNFLNCHGYITEDARLVKDAGRIYIIYQIRGGLCHVGHSPAESYVPRILLEKQDPLLPEYLDRFIRKFSRAIEGLAQSQHPDLDALTRQKEILADLNTMRKESAAWQL